MNREKREPIMNQYFAGVQLLCISISMSNDTLQINNE